MQFKMNTWRLIIEEEVNDSYMKMAIDEALLTSVGSSESKPTLRFYKWNRPAVAIGYFQSIKKEVNIDACRHDNVEIFRRMTGGGAVYKDPDGELNYSLIIPESLTKQNIIESYSHICSAVISGLALLDIRAEFKGINDITVGEKKISGNAQTRSKGAVLQHGTILLDFHPEKMVKYLNICDEKFSDKFIKNAKDRVGTIKRLYPKITEGQLIDSITRGFSSVFGIAFQEDRLTDREKKTAEDLYAAKYSAKEWNYWK